MILIVSYLLLLLYYILLNAQKATISSLTGRTSGLAFPFILDTNKLYLLVYTINKEEFEFDLINKAKELDVESKYLLNFYNKYSKYNNNQK